MIRIDKEENSIIVGEKDHLQARRFAVSNINLLVEIDEIPDEATVKIRYKHQGNPAIIRLSGETATVIFNEPQRAVTPGQSAVFYAGEKILGGGIIDEVAGD